MTLIKYNNTQGCSSPREYSYGCYTYHFDIKLRNKKKFMVSTRDIANIVGTKINILTDKLTTQGYSWGLKSKKSVVKVIFSNDVG